MEIEEGGYDYNTRPMTEYKRKDHGNMLMLIISFYQPPPTVLYKEYWKANILAVRQE